MVIFRVRVKDRVTFRVIGSFRVMVRLRLALFLTENNENEHLIFRENKKITPCVPNITLSGQQTIRNADVQFLCVRKCTL